MTTVEFVLLTVTAVSGTLSAIAAAGAVSVASRVAQTQKMLSQRQLIIPLWEYMTKLNEIDPKKPVVKHVLDAVHALELVALCCEGGMVDEQVIKRTFRDPFIKSYEDILQCPDMPSLRRNGQAILRENLAASSFYERLKQEQRDRDKLLKV